MLTPTILYTYLLHFYFINYYKLLQRIGQHTKAMTTRNYWFLREDHISGPPCCCQPIGKYHVSFFGDSAPHQLQTNGLNLIRLFNPMALKFDTSSNYKKTISPLKCFKPYVVSMVLKTSTVKELKKYLIIGFMVGPGSDRWSNR